MTKSNFFFVLTVLFVVLIQSGSCFAKKFDDKGFTFFEWQNPTPKFSDFGFDPENIRAIIGKAQLCISHKERDIDVFTYNDGKGKVQTYKNARFVTSMVILDKSRDDVIKAYLDFDAYPKMMNQFTDVGIIKTQEDAMLVKLKQTYKIVIFNLCSDYRYIYKKESSGEYSTILLDGDVGAGVGRIEFIPMGENQTLVFNTVWLDIDSARFVFRSLLNAQPDLKPTAPLGSLAMMTEQYRTYIENSDPNPPENIESLPTTPETPLFNTSHIPIDTLRRLSDLGTMVFIYPKQWVKTEKGPKSVQFISVSGQAPYNINKILPYSRDFSRMPEYVPQAKKIEITEKTKDYNIVDWYFKFGLGVLRIGIDYTIKSHHLDENTIVFSGIKGDLFPLHGAWEWVDLQKDSTLIVFTSALQISDDASWTLKLGNKLPNISVLSTVFIGILIVEKQIPWLENINSTPPNVQ